MSRLAQSLEVTIGERRVELRPNLRAALRLSREFGGIGPLLKGIAEGSVTITLHVIRECAISGAFPEPLFGLKGKPFAIVEANLKGPALQLVEGFVSVDTDEPTPERTKSKASAKPFDAVKHFEDLFGFATGILRWTPEAAWNATPLEIMTAAAFRQRAYVPKDKVKVETPHADLTLGQQARKLFANIGTRIERPSDAK